MSLKGGNYWLGPLFLNSHAVNRASRTSAGWARLLGTASTRARGLGFLEAPTSSKASSRGQVVQGGVMWGFWALVPGLAPIFL